MIRFRNFRNPPYSPHEAQIVLHAICNLLGKDFQLEPQNFNPFTVSKAICDTLSDFGNVKQPTSDSGMCQILVQDLIDVLVEKHLLTIQEIESETMKVSEGYPPVFYPSMP